MKKLELKDGMVLKTRDGKKFQKLTGNYLYSFQRNELSELSLYSYKEDMCHECLKDMDIMEVTYVGEEVWKRREYYTLIDALQNKPDDKCIKHKDCPKNAGKAATVDNIIQAYMAWLSRSSVSGMSIKEANIKAIEQINEKVWEYI